MTLEEIPVLYRNVWAIYEALRRFGFSDDQILYIAGPVVLVTGEAYSEPWLSIELQAQGTTFVANVGPLDRGIDEARVLWEKIRAGIGDHSIEDETLQRIWKESAMSDERAVQSLALAIMNRGIDIPLLAN